MIKKDSSCLKNAKRGFSLAESLIVMLMVSVLAMMVMPVITKKRVVAEKKVHGIWACRMDDNGNYLQVDKSFPNQAENIDEELSKLRDRDWKAPARGECEFPQLPPDVQELLVKVYGGGAGGELATAEPYGIAGNGPWVNEEGTLNFGQAAPEDGYYFLNYKRPYDEYEVIHSNFADCDNVDNKGNCDPSSVYYNRIDPDKDAAGVYINKNIEGVRVPGLASYCKNKNYTNYMRIAGDGVSGSDQLIGSCKVLSIDSGTGLHSGFCCNNNVKPSFGEWMNCTVSTASNVCLPNTATVSNDNKAVVYCAEGNADPFVNRPNKYGWYTYNSSYSKILGDNKIEPTVDLMKELIRKSVLSNRSYYKKKEGDLYKLYGTPIPDDSGCVEYSPMAHTPKSTDIDVSKLSAPAGVRGSIYLKKGQSITVQEYKPESKSSYELHKSLYRLQEGKNGNTYYIKIGRQVIATIFGPQVLCYDVPASTGQNDCEKAGGRPLALFETQPKDYYSFMRRSDRPDVPTKLAISMYERPMRDANIASGYAFNNKYTEFGKPIGLQNGAESTSATITYNKIAFRWSHGCQGGEGKYSDASGLRVSRSGKYEFKVGKGGYGAKYLRDDDLVLGTILKQAAQPGGQTYFESVSAEGGEVAGGKCNGTEVQNVGVLGGAVAKGGAGGILEFPMGTPERDYSKSMSEDRRPKGRWVYTDGGDGKSGIIVVMW